MPGGDAPTALKFAGGAFGVDLGETSGCAASVDEEAGIANVGASSGADVNALAAPVPSGEGPLGLTGILLRPVRWPLALQFTPEVERMGCLLPIVAAFNLMLL